MRIKLILFFGLYLTINAAAQTSLRGSVTDAETGEALLVANVVAYDENGVFAAGTSTDFDGQYAFSLDPGVYDIEVSYVGYPSNRIAGVIVKAGQVTTMDIELMQQLEILPIWPPLYTPIYLDVSDPDGMPQRLYPEEIERAPVKRVEDLVLPFAGLTQY